MYRNFVVGSVFYLIIVIIIAHFVAPDTYVWTENTISDLGAQAYNKAWIMRLGFIGFGLMLSVGIWEKYKNTKTIVMADLFLIVYSISVLLTGIFGVMPFNREVAYSITHDILHTIFAQIAGFAFALSILLHAFIAKEIQIRMFHIVFLIAVGIISLLVGLSADSIIDFRLGVTQRFLWFVSFSWLLATYLKYSNSE